MKIEFLDTRKKCLILGMTTLVLFFLLGSSMLSGLLFVAIMARYETGRKQASLPFIVCHTIRNISSPFIGYLGKRFGLVTITGAGCLLASIGIGACYFAEDIVVVILLWGIIYGLGLGMGTALLPQVLSNHFEDHIDKAIGIACGGGSLGAFILPILVDRIIIEYGTSGMFMILSGIILNGVPAALLLRKLDNSVLKCKKNADRILKGSIYGKHEITESIKKDYIHEGKHVTNMERNIEISRHQNKGSSENFKIFELQNDTIFYINAQQEYKINESTYHEGPKHPKALNAFINENTLTDVKIVAEDRNIHHPAILQNVVCSEPHKESSELTNNSLYSQCSRKGKLSSTPSNSFHVFLDVTYILILLTMGFMQIVITTLGTVIVDASKDKGVPESDGVDILICMGFTDMIGRFCLGYITDGGYMTKINFQILCIAGFVIFHILFIFVEGFIMVMISVGFVGFFTAGHIMINIGIINQCIEKEFLTMASASRFFAFAFMSFVQAPMIGFFRENLKSYNGLFILMSGISGICMILTWLTPIAAKRRDKKKVLR